jgi:hypothetical protein
MSKDNEGQWNLTDEERKIEAELENWLPRKGDQLFVASAGAAFVDCLGFTGYGEERSPIGRHSLYSGGYLLAADRLVETLLGTAHEDALIYPIFYLYRHHIELELKESLYPFVNRLHAGTEEQRKQLKKTFGRHSIKELWDTLKIFAPTIIARISTETTAAFESLVEEIDHYDGSGEEGRYAFYKDGKPTFSQLQAVNLGHLKLQFHKMSHYLGGLSEEIL